CLHSAHDRALQGREAALRPPHSPVSARTDQRSYCRPARRTVREGRDDTLNRTDTMHPSIHARSTPDKPAVIMAESGEALSYADLDRRSNQGAQLFRALGLAPGATIAMCLSNSPVFYE